VSIVWVGKVKKKTTDFENLDSFSDTLSRAGKISNVRHAWTLKKLMGRVKEITRATTVEQTLHK